MTRAGYPRGVTHGVSRHDPAIRTGGRHRAGPRVRARVRPDRPAAEREAAKERLRNEMRRPGGDDASETESAAKSGFQWEALNHPVNAYRVPDLIPDLEKIIQESKPDTVLLPQPSYNQDHRAVYDAAITALRPHDQNWYVRNVLVFEQPDSLLWPHGGETEPNYFQAISLKEKLHSYSLYTSQVRGHRACERFFSLPKERISNAGAIHLADKRQ